MKITIIAAAIFFLAADQSIATDCIAHRGFSSSFPENTLLSIDEAWKAGADIVEVDVRILADRTIILFHDDRIEKVYVRSLTYSDLQQRTPHHVPTLAEALEHGLKSRRVILDLKDYTSRFLEDLSDLLDKQGDTSNLIFQSRNASVLKELKSRFPESGLMFLTSLDRTGPNDTPPDPALLAKQLKQNGISGVSAKGRQFVDRDYVKVFQDHGLLYYVWTINPTDRIAHYQKLGVDGIITDCPDLMKRTGRSGYE